MGNQHGGDGLLEDESKGRHGAPQQGSEGAGPDTSGEFVLSQPCHALLVHAQLYCELAIVPVLFQMASYFEASRSNPLDTDEMLSRKAFLSAVLNRANRVPPNSDFESNWENNLGTLVGALKARTSQEATLAYRLRNRVPKYTSILHACHITPHIGSFEDDYQGNLRELLRVLLPREVMDNLDAALSPRHGLTKESKLPRVILTLSSAPTDRQFAQLLCDDLCKAMVPTELVFAEDPRWFARCEHNDVCVPLLSEAFVMSSWCEGKLTFAKDYGKRIVPIVVDHEGYERIMSGHVPSQEPWTPGLTAATF